ncbi:MAG: PHP domain-containing protein [Clostridia bacterium]|nr:PHP domain-containing protein [Clostridia bacterium]
MKKFLLPEEGKFYKANLHCHSTVSDGQWTPEEIKERYMAEGYSVVAYTDHDVLIPHTYLKDENFLPLNGLEVEINEDDSILRTKKSCHICMIALSEDNLIQPCYHRTKFIPPWSEKYRPMVKFDESKSDFEREYTGECISRMMKEARDEGFFVTYNHPAWSLESYPEYSAYHNMHAMEIINYGCLVYGYNDYNEKEYDDLLRMGRRIYCVAGDDNHNGLPDSFGGFTMIKAKSLTYEEITGALVEGNFYASMGPEIHSLWFEDGFIHIKTSPAATIVSTSGIRRVGRAVNTEEAKFEVCPEDIYVRITVTDKEGKHANTNAYFTDELF